jgi:N-acetylglutamate synthase
MSAVAHVEKLELERLVVGAWPASEVTERDGWLLRASGGPTRRGNSVATLGAEGGARLDDRIDGAEAWYRERGRAPTFQIGPCAAPAGLDGALDARGYLREGETLFARASLASVLEHVGPASADLPMGLAARVETAPDAGWLELNASSSRFASSMEVFRAFLGRLGARCRFISVDTPQGETVGSGLGIASGAFLGVYAMFTRADHRRRGVAQRALAALAQSAHRDGSTRDLYLLVEVQNAGALRLYTQCGFRAEYSYHYRLAKR